MGVSLILLGLAPLASGPVETSACRSTIAAVEAGAVIDAGNTIAVGCGEGQGSARLRFDRRAGVIRARAALAAGERLGRVYLAPPPGVRPGDAVALTARIGVVTVSRQAVALQAVRPGKRFFARGDDGAVFVAPPFTPEPR